MTGEVRYTSYSAPFGNLFVASTERGICSVSLGNLSKQEFLAQLRDELRREPVEDRAHFRELTEDLKRYFSGERAELHYPLDLLKATDFQKKVWLQVRKIPYGETRTYREIAEGIGRPQAFRAVGQTLGRNPVPILIPCHRVIGSDGSLVGFGSGVRMKEWLLQLESVR